MLKWGQNRLFKLVESQTSILGTYSNDIYCRNKDLLGVIGLWHPLLS